MLVVDPGGRQESCYATFWTLPDRMHDVQTRSRLPAPLIKARTGCKFTFHRRLVTLCAWLIRLPNCGPRPQISQVFAIKTEISLRLKLRLYQCDPSVGNFGTAVACRGPEGLVDSVDGERHPKTILVVDDADSIRKMVCAMLRQSGYHCLDAADGEAALQII